MQFTILTSYLKNIFSRHCEGGTTEAIFYFQRDWFASLAMTDARRVIFERACKCFCLAFILPILFFSCRQEKKTEGGYLIHGAIKNAAGETVFLEEIRGNQAMVLDSARIETDGSFELSGIVSGKKIYSFRIGQKAALVLVVENKEIRLHADINDMDNYTVSGSEESLILKNLNHKIREDYQQMNALRQQYQEAFYNDMQQHTPDSLKQSIRIDRQYSQVFSAQQQFLSVFIDTVKSALLAIYATNFVNPEAGYTAYQVAAEKAKKQMPHAEETKFLLEKAETLRRLAPGAVAPEINLPGPSGNPLALSSLRGKVVLIDFWASWCKPCRVENPNLVSIYKQYKDKDFIIYSVSYDKEKAKWIDAIREDKLTWKEHVIIPAGDMGVTKDYQVAAIPTSYLIDKEGKIAGKNLKGKELEEKLNELLAQ